MAAAKCNVKRRGTAFTVAGPWHIEIDGKDSPATTKSVGNVSDVLLNCA
jgi:hypothetical protein